MSWLDDLLRVRRQPPPAKPVQAVPFPDGERPSWAGGTALYRTLGGRELPTFQGQDETPITPAFVDGGQLVKRVPTWETRQGDTVTIGDVVALYLLDYPDATGRIVAAADAGRVECELAHGKRLKVEVDNLVMLLTRGGDTSMRDFFDANSSVRNFVGTAPLDPKTEGGEGEGGENSDATA